MEEPRLRTICGQLLNNEPESPNSEKVRGTYKIYNGILYQKLKDNWRIIVPESIINRLIWECHEYYLHCGAQTCYSMLAETFIFKNMNRRIRTTLATCDSCQRCKISTHPLQGTAQGIKCFQKNDHIAVDIIGPLPTSVGNVKYILIVLDIYTKFVKLYLIRRADTKTIINKLFNQHFIEHGLPNKIQSDNATQFKSELWFNKLEANNIIPIYSPLYHPCFNMAERPIKEVKRCLRTYCSNKHQNWARCIPDINICLNEVQHETTGFTPNELQLVIKDTRFWEKYITNPFIINSSSFINFCIIK